MSQFNPGLCIHCRGSAIKWLSSRAVPGFVNDGIAINLELVKHERMQVWDIQRYNFPVPLSHDTMWFAGLSRKSHGRLLIYAELNLSISVRIRSSTFEL
jgi:hypothetical protein